MSLSAPRPLQITLGYNHQVGYLGGLVVKESACSAGDSGNVGLIPGLGRSPGEGNGNLFQYSCLGNPMDRGAQGTIVHGIAKSWTQLKQQTMYYYQVATISVIVIISYNNIYSLGTQVICKGLNRSLDPWG